MGKSDGRVLATVESIFRRTATDVGTLDFSAHQGRSDDVSVLESFDARRIDSSPYFGNLAATDGLSGKQAWLL